MMDEFVKILRLVTGTAIAHDLSPREKKNNEKIIIQISNFM